MLNHEFSLLLQWQSNPVGFYLLTTVKTSNFKTYLIITDNSDIVLNKWKNYFQTLLNLNVDSNSDRIENYSIKENIVCNELDDEITINEVYKTVMGANNGKSPDIDLIQAEVCKNQIVIYVLHTLFNLCFKTGKVPSMWTRGIITPIPNVLNIVAKTCYNISIRRNSFLFH